MSTLNNTFPAPRDSWVEEIIQKMGGVNHVARLLGLSQPAVAKWKRTIPPLRAVQLYLIAEEENIDDVYLEDFFPYLIAQIKQHDVTTH